MNQDKTIDNTSSRNEWQKEGMGNAINQDLLRLREMNEVFAKMNHQHFHDNNEYYSYYLQETSSLSIYQGQPNCQQESMIEHVENGQNTERSNSLLFTLSEKDDDETRPTMHMNYIQYDSPIYTDFQPQNQNNFGQYFYDQNQSLNVNNTLFQQKPLHKNVFTNLNCPKVHQSRYFQSRLSPLQNFGDERKEQSQIRGFSKYEEFAIKISKLFNIQVEDLEIIYNRLQAEKQNQKQEARSQGLTSEVEFTDSEVMKKLFDYGLQIKNSHNRLKNIITTIDSRIQKRPKTNQNTISQTQMENVSLNFMLEEELNRSQFNKTREKQQGDTMSKGLSNKNGVIFGKKDNLNVEQYNTLESKDSIIGKLDSIQRPTFEVLSGQTIQSFNSMAYSQKTDTKSHKSKKNSKVTERIKLISQQLESLKKQIDKDDSQEEEPNISRPLQSQTIKADQLYINSEIKKEINSGLQNHQNVKLSSFQLKQPITSIQKNESNQQSKVQLTLAQTRETQPYAFGGQTFTYVKSVHEIREDDPQIDKKIQQIVKTCIVKSPSKKSSIIQKTQAEKSQVSQVKQIQKIIVEPVPAQNMNQKYSFKSQTFQPNEPSNLDIRAQNREKMFRSITQLRKSFSKNKKASNNSPVREIKKTSNNAYLQDEPKNQKQQIKVEQSLNEQRPFEKKSSIFVEKNFQNTNVVSDHLLNEKKKMMEKNESQKNEDKKSTPVQQINITSQEIPHFLSNKNIHFTPQNYQSIVTEQYELPTQRINYSQQYSQPILKRQPSKDKINVIQSSKYQNLEVAKTVESQPFIESQKSIQKHLVNKPKVIYPPNQTLNFPPKVFSGNQKINITISPKNGTNFYPHNLNVNLNQIQQFRIPNIKSIKISRPLTPVQIVKSQNFPPQNLTQRSFSTQKLRSNDNLSPRYIYVPRANNFFEIRKNGSKMIDQSFENSLTNRPIQVAAITQRESRSVQRKYSVPIKTVTPQKRNLESLKEPLIEEPSSKIPFKTSIVPNHRSQKSQDFSLSSQPQLTQRNFKDPNIKQQNANFYEVGSQSVNLKSYSEAQTPYFSSGTNIQSQRQTMIESKNLSATGNIHTLKNFKKQVEPKLQQSFMYYGPINPTLQKALQQSNLMISRKNQSVVRAFPIQLQQSQKMNNSVYAKQEIAQKNSLQQIPFFGSKYLHQQNESVEKKPLNFSNQTPRIPRSLRPPKYVPPKQSDIHLQKFLDIQSNKHDKILQGSKLLKQPIYGSDSSRVKTYTLGNLVQSEKGIQIIDESKKSHKAINASTVKSPQYQLQDSTPSFGAFNEENYSNTLFVSPFSKPLSNLIDSRNSSESKRSAVSSRSKSGKKGIALQSKRSKSPRHTFVQSSYMP